MTGRSHWSTDGALHFGVGIEDTFVPQESPGYRRLDEYELTQHYDRWREDLSLAAESGADLIRWGIPWYLMEPSPGEFDWTWLDQVAEHLQRLGLRCVVDLVHYGAPLWLEGSFLDPEYPDRVASYARAVAERYAGIWDDFTPLNEPVINAIWAGEIGMWPPALRGQDGFLKVALALARGIVRTQHSIAEVNPEARFVHVDAAFLWEGEDGPISGDMLRERRFLPLDLVMGRVDEIHPLRGYLAAHGVSDAELDWFLADPVTPDLIGVNYYPAFSTQRFLAGETYEPVEAGVPGLRQVMGEYWDRYGVPLAVTETSRAGEPELRVQWLRESVAEIETLRAEGMPIAAYTWFPFLTLVDWLYRTGSTPADEWFVHMGLVDLVRDAFGVLRRHRTIAFPEFQSLVRKHGLARD